MRRWRLSAGLLLAALALWAILYSLPQHYTFTAQGIMYQLGDDNRDNITKIAVTIDGKMKKSLAGVRTFTGVIDIEGEDIPVPEEMRELKITFRKDGEGQMLYRLYENGTVKHFSYGSIFINEDLSQMAIMKYSKENSDGPSGSWNSGNGYMIAAPALNRDDALEVANELMHDYLQGDTLE